LGAKFLVVLCAGSTLQLAKQALDEAPYKLSGAVAKLASITFWSLAFSYWIDNLGFITEGKLAAIFIKPSLGVSNWPVIYMINYTPTVFWHHSTPRHQGAKGREGRRRREDPPVVFPCSSSKGEFPHPS
jgi:hypothetical protein